MSEPGFYVRKIMTCRERRHGNGMNGNCSAWRPQEMMRHGRTGSENSEMDIYRSFYPWKAAMLIMQSP